MQTLRAQPLETPLLPTSVSPFCPEIGAFCVGCEDGSVYVVALRDNVLSLEARLAFHSAPVTSISLRTAVPQTRHNAESPAVRNLLLTASFDWQIALWAPSVSTFPPSER